MQLLNYKIYSEDGTISFRKPIMVLVHGLGGGYANWVCQVRYLKERYDLLLIELPSHGKSKVKMSEMTPNFESVTQKVMEVLDLLHIEKATFVGASLGSLVVKHIVFTRPEKVDKYILIGPIGKFTFLFRVAIRLALFLLPIAPLDFVVKLVCRVIMPFKSLEYGRNLFFSCARRIERKEFTAWGRVLLSFKNAQKQYAKNMKDEPNGLYIVGTMDYLFLTMLSSDMKRIKNMEIVPNAGHLCNIDQYKKVNKMIIAFQDGEMAERVPPKKKLSV